ncbi:DUF5681 domain-containing protein [Aminobacter aminovorans]|uniref:DUF5681 domain-containing protein n=1 Tax=Aminobacter aminovorans TaxID=83263 RepID=A0AAC8YKL5_AMIAI|nr:DUF5681 domain-containing protein [Aminobacter aminovorans]AMS40150.1 hypothetical protein AA2016_1215 [Aminobacter aminovorans]MBB3709877.1 hypothetical protein [Aminobacter aminovorans]
MTRIVRKVRGETIAPQSPPPIRRRRMPPFTPTSSFPSEPPAEPDMPLASRDAASPTGDSAGGDHNGSSTEVARRVGAGPRAAGSDYEIGYGKPPRRSQFKPGQSGNPKGRPKSALSFKTLLTRELKQLVEIREGNGTRKISKKEAAVKSLLQKALKGDLHALKTITTLVGDDAETHQPTNEQSLSAVDEAQLRRLLGDEAVDQPIGAKKAWR